MEKTIIATDETIEDIYMDAMFAGSALEKNGHIPAWHDKTKIDPDNEFRHW